MSRKPVLCGVFEGTLGEGSSMWGRCRDCILKLEFADWHEAAVHIEIMDGEHAVIHY